MHYVVILIKSVFNKNHNHYYYQAFVEKLLDQRFKFQLSVCNVCHNVLKTSVEFSSIAILDIHDVDYCCVINGISKDEAIKILKNAV